MGVLEIVFGVILLLFALGIIAVVLLQEGRQAGLSGVIQGGADSFLAKNKARTVDAFLSRSTKYIAIVFFVMNIVMNIVVALMAK